MNSIRTSTLALLLIAAPIAVPAMTRGGGIDVTGGQATPVVAAAEVRQSGGLTLSQAVAQVKRQYGGRVISAETQVVGNREVHVIKVLTDDGKVKTVKVNGRRL